MQVCAAGLTRCRLRLCFRAQITPKRNGADFIFASWIPATVLPPSSPTDSSMVSTAPPAPALSLLAGGTNNAWTAMVGLLMSQYLLLVYDTPSHMAEARALQPQQQAGCAQLQAACAWHERASDALRCAARSPTGDAERGEERAARHHRVLRPRRLP